MDISQLRYQIESSFVGCRTCEESIDTWPDADPKSEPGHKVIYSARDALFVGMCNSAHANEFFIAEVKADEIIPHDVTERTIGTFTPQSECKHGRRAKFSIPAGQAMPTSDGVVEGPATGYVCGLCLCKFGIVKGEQKKSALGLLGPDGAPL